MKLTEEQIQTYKAAISNMQPTKIDSSFHVTEYIYYLHGIIIQVLTTIGGEIKDGQFTFFTPEEWEEYKKPLGQTLNEITIAIEKLANGTEEEKARYREYKKKKEELRDELYLITHGHKRPRPTGINLISEERVRQITLGYDALHDSTETNGELAVAAGLYAIDSTYADTMIREWSDVATDGSIEVYNDLWPWNDGSYPNKCGQLERIRQLTIAGALIAAEIDRLQNIEEKTK